MLDQRHLVTERLPLLLFRVLLRVLLSSTTASIFVGHGRATYILVKHCHLYTLVKHCHL